MDAVGCVLLPASCSLCGSHLPQLSSVPICDACWTEIPVQGDSVCVRCGDSLNNVEREQPTDQCRTCRMAPPPFVRAVSYGLYAGRMREAIHALKYERLHPASRTLGRMLAYAIAQLAPQAPAEMLVIPVPLHKVRHSQRGFNQARALASVAIKALRKSHPEWKLTLAPTTLLRQRATGSQAGLTPRQRRVNLRGAFRVSNAEAVVGKHVLIIDDIFTTGATARAAARELIAAGAESVWVATLARARRIHPIVSSAVEQKGVSDGEVVLGSQPQQASISQPSF
jgi:ComF family protein